LEAHIEKLKKSILYREFSTVEEFEGELRKSLLTELLGITQHEHKVERKEQNQERGTQKRELRNALYSELAHLYCLLKETLDEYTYVHFMEAVFQVPDEITKIVKIMRDIKDNYFNVYKFTRKDPVLFYQLSDAQAIDEIYRYFAWMTNEIIELFSPYEKALPSPADIPSVAKNQRLKVGMYLNSINAVLTQSVTSGFEIDLLAQFVTRENCKRFIKESVEEAKKQS